MVGENAILHMGGGPVTMPWTFLNYVAVVNGKDVNLIGDWYAIQDTGVRAEFDRVVLLLKYRDDWHHPDISPEYFKDLDPPHRGLSELRFWIDQKYPGMKRATRRRFRPVGVRTGERAFTLLIGCEKWGNNYCPFKAFDLALQYQADLVAGKGKTVEHHI